MEEPLSDSGRARVLSLFYTEYRSRFGGLEELLDRGLSRTPVLRCQVPGKVRTAGVVGM